jgi:hypothetical protein
VGKEMRGLGRSKNRGKEGRWIEGWGEGREGRYVGVRRMGNADHF